MARILRFEHPGVAQHIVLWSNAQPPCFVDADDRLAYLDLLEQACHRHGCALHAYVLMDNHVRLLLTPGQRGAVAQVLEMLARGRDQRGSRTQRPCRQWERRYQAGSVESAAEVLDCQRSIELNPVRAWIVSEPSAYRWSSHGANAFGDPDPRLEPHPAYLRLGTSSVSRMATYRRLFAMTPADAGVLPLTSDWSSPPISGSDRSSVEPAGDSGAGLPSLLHGDGGARAAGDVLTRRVPGAAMGRDRGLDSDRPRSGATA